MLNETYNFVQSRRMIFKLRRSRRAGTFESKFSLYCSPNPASARISDHEFGHAETGSVMADAPDICVFAG